MIDYSELKKQAEAARDNCPIWYAADCFSLRHMDLGDSSFVDEANPRAVLALIEANEQMLGFLAEISQSSGDNWAVMVARNLLKEFR